MSVDIEKLRALCAEVPESLTVDYRGDVVVGVDGIAAERTGVHPVGSLFPLVLRSPRGDCDSLAVARLAAAARPAILALCDRVERAEAEAERLRAENAALRASIPDGCAKCSFDAAAWGPPVMESVTADSPESLWWVEGTITLTVRVELRGVEVSASSEAEAIETAIEKHGVDGDVVSHTLTVTSLAPEVTP